MKHLLIIFLLIISIDSFSQKKDSASKKMTAQDSAQVLQIEYNKFIDSLISKTSVKQLYDFFTETITVKQYQEGKWVDLYDFFVRTKGNAWLQNRSKPKN